MPEPTSRPAVTSGRNAAEGGGLAALGILAGSWYARMVANADPTEIAAVASLIPYLVNQGVHMLRNKKAGT